jgi:predicted nucleic acid-binding protein
MTSSRVVLSDSGPLYAAADTTDQYHERAQRELAIFASRRWRVLTLESTMLETHRLFMQNVGAQRARAWLAQSRGGLGRVRHEQEDYERALDIVLRFRDQDLIIFDALLYVVSERLSLPIWTYDHHFDILRANRWQP